MKIFKSIRWSLQLWHAGLLAVVVSGFGAVSYYGLSRAHYQQVDLDLEHSVQSLATEIRFPMRPPPGGGRFGGGGPNDGPPDAHDRPPPGQGQGPGRWNGDGGPGGPNGGPMRDPPFRDGRPPQDFDNGPPRDGGGRGGPGGRDGGRADPSLTHIEVPAPLAQRFGNGTDGSIYYVIWDYDHAATVTSLADAATVPDVGPPPVPPFARDQNGAPGQGGQPGMNGSGQMRGGGGAGNRGGGGPIMTPTFRLRGDYREAYMNGPAGSRLLVGKSLVPDQIELQHSAWLLGGTGAAVLLIGLVGGWILSLRAVRPIRSITAAAQAISASNLSQRIDEAATQSELGTLATVLNSTFDRLETAFQQQVRFTADASHELRTPLAVIHTHTQLALSRERTAEEYRKTIETCLRASGRMKELVDSLLVLAKADAGRLTLDYRPFDLAQTTEDCIAMLQPVAAEKQVTIEAALQPAQLTADPSKLAQVLMNLLTNAIRYNKPGGGRVRVATEVSPAPGVGAAKEIVLTIADTGVGIPTDSVGHVFDRFYRVDSARNRESGGSGLGLAICKSIVEAHGGTISVTSEMGVGTTFTFRIPQAPAGRTAPPTPPA